MTHKDIDYEYFNPFLRYAYICTKSAALKNYLQPLYAYEHRMFFVTEGRICVVTQGQGSFCLEQGDCLILDAGIGYQITFDERDANFAIISFDFDSAGYGKKSRHPDRKESFDEKEIFSVYTPEFVGKTALYIGCFDVQGLIHEMCRLFATDFDGKYDCLSALIKCVIIKLCQIRESSAQNTGHDLLVERIKGYIDKEFSENINNSSVAAHFGYHPYYIGDIFRKATGMTLHEYILYKRIIKAKNLLTGTFLSVNETAQLCGFSNSCYFSECFKKYTGTSPLKYRKSIAERK